MKLHWMSGCIPSLLGLLLLSVIAVEGRQTATPPAQQPPFIFSQATTIIYVRDFELDAENFQADEGRSKVVQRPGSLNGPRRQEKDPEVQATKMVDCMASDIVNDLKKAGYKSQRLGALDARPATGVWVHGVFTELDEGNRLHRAVIGFGSGEATRQLHVTMNDLAHPDKPLYNTSENGTSGGKKPGAVISMNSYAAAAKFVMEKNAPEKTIHKTASQISTDIIQHLKEHEAAPAPK